MVRQIIHIDEEKCNGCGLCATACHEGAIDIVDGKAKLMRENFCDGFGDCLPGCPTGAITFEQREAPEYDEAAVKEAQEKKALDEKGRELFRAATPFPMGAPSGVPGVTAGAGLHEGGCPGSRTMTMHREDAQSGCPGSRMAQFARQEEEVAPAFRPVSRLEQWPVQIKLLPTRAPFYDGAKLLIAADCTAYVYANMHEQFMKGKITLIGCPKLDDIDYSDKLTEIIANNDIKSVTVVRMEVPCCGGLQHAAEVALQRSGKFIPWQVVTISRDGEILD